MKCRLRNLFSVFITLFLFLSLTVSAEAKKLIPMGDSIGIQLQLPFVYVANDVLLPNGEWIRRGDIITKVNGKKISSMEAFTKSIKDENVTLTLKQKGKEKEISITNQQASNIIPFLKDETDGIGTLTFIDPESKQYGALGHQIIDGVLNKAPDFTEGSIFLASIEQIKKSVPGHPGYKISVIDRNNIRLGSINTNDVYGIFGNWESNLHGSLRKPIEIMPEKDIQLGKAKLYTAIEGSEVQSFNIEIVKVEDNFFQFVVTDRDLLEKTGGILQGMSGSPIIQGNKFVGAVTHMFVEQPKKGAAITVSEMLKKTPK